MSIFWDSPFNLNEGDNIYAKVSATNQYGAGELSDKDNSPDVQVITVPHAPNTPTKGSASDHTQNVIEWSTHTNGMTGGSTVLEYELEENKGSWRSIFTSTDLATTYTQTSGIDTGTYQYRIRMRNIYGWGDYSDILSITVT